MEKKALHPDFNEIAGDAGNPLSQTEQVITSLFSGVSILGNNIVKIDGTSEKEEHAIEVRLYNTENQFGPSRLGILIAVISIHENPDDADVLSSNRYELRYINHQKVLCKRVRTTEGFEREVCDDPETLQVGEILADSSFYKTGTE